MYLATFQQLRNICCSSIKRPVNILYGGSQTSFCRSSDACGNQPIEKRPRMLADGFRVVAEFAWSIERLGQLGDEVYGGC